MIRIKFMVGWMCVISGISVSQAVQIYTLDEHNEIQAELSLTELNRVTVEKDRIKDVFSTGVSLDIVSDERLGHIYIKGSQPYPKEGVRVTLTTESGCVQDMRLKMTKGSGQTLILTESRPEHKPNKEESYDTLLADVQNLIHGKVPSAYQIIGEGEGARYQSSTYVISEEPYVNTSLFPMSLQEPEFVTHLGVKAIVIENPELEPGQSTRIWRVESRD